METRLKEWVCLRRMLVTLIHGFVSGILFLSGFCWVGEIVINLYVV